MKKIMSVLLGLSLVLGVASISFGQDTTTKSTEKSKKSKKSKKSTDTTKATS